MDAIDICLQTCTHGQHFIAEAAKKIISMLKGHSQGHQRTR